MRGKIKDCPLCGAAPKINRFLTKANDLTIKVEWSIICSACGLVKTRAYPTWYEITTDETFKRVSSPEGEVTALDGYGEALTEWARLDGKDATEDPDAPLDVTVDDNDIMDVMGVTPGVSEDYETTVSEADIEEVLS